MTASRLAIEAWVPAHVAHQVHMLHAQALEAGSPEGADLVQRLACDQRMRLVWKEIAKHRRRDYRPTATFKYPAFVPSSVDPGEPGARQAIAAGLLFHYAVSFRLLGARAIPVRLLDAGLAVDVDDPLVVDRDRADAEARGYTICLLATCRDLFGGPMWRTVARIASVTFEREITAEAVKEWSRNQTRRAARAYPPTAKVRA
jgi:hypothetical protein